jgi:hypothetical protein
MTRNPKVEEPKVPNFIAHYIFRLNIPVNDLSALGTFEGLHHMEPVIQLRLDARLARSSSTKG